MPAHAHKLGNIRDSRFNVDRFYIRARDLHVINGDIANTQDIAEQGKFLCIIAVVFKLDQLFNRVAQIIRIIAAAGQRSPQLPDSRPALGRFLFRRF